MSESDGREIDPLTGYPRMEESSPSEGAHTEGASPGSGEAPPSGQDSRHEPPPDSPRFNEIYRNWKETARELEETRQQLAERDIQRSLYGEPQQQQPATAHPGNQDDDDPMEQFYRGIEERFERKLQPLMERFAQQEKQTVIQKQVTALKASHGDYEPSRDDPVLAATIKRYGVNNLEAAYRLAFPERVVHAQAQQQQQAATRAPVGDIRGSSPQAPAHSAEELMREFQATKDPRRREEIATILSDGGAWGASRAEKALGLY